MSKKNKKQTTNKQMNSTRCHNKNTSNRTEE
jgi:hypothetical protein